MLAYGVVGSTGESLCRQYGAECVTDDGPEAARLSACLAGLRWAREKELDLLVHLSSRFVPLLDWVPTLQALAWETQYATYSNQCTATGQGFRGECAAFHVPSWFAAGAVDALQNLLDRRQFSDALEDAVLHGLARSVHERNCPANKRFEGPRPRLQPVSGYGDWGLPGTDRTRRLPHVLWGDACTPEEYCRALRQWGIASEPQDFLEDGPADPARELAARYDRARLSPSDINEHLPTLTRLASECRRVTEMGTRGANSTTAFLAARPERLTAYDVQRHPEVAALEDLARRAGIPFEFIQADVLAADIEETDLLFIDTLHVYEQTRQELRRHAPKVRKFLVFHDIVSFGSHGETPGAAGIWPAIEGFLDAHPEWTLAERHDNNNGLAVLRRLNGDA